DRAAREEGRGARDLGVKLRDPVAQRRLGREHESHKGAASDSEIGTVAGEGCHSATGTAGRGKGQRIFGGSTRCWVLASVDPATSSERTTSGLSVRCPRSALCERAA